MNFLVRTVNFAGSNICVWSAYAELTSDLIPIQKLGFYPATEYGAS